MLQALRRGLPVGVGLALGERPSALAGVGGVLALIAVVLVSREASDEPLARRESDSALVVHLDLGERAPVASHERPGVPASKGGTRGPVLRLPHVSVGVARSTVRANPRALRVGRPPWGSVWVPPFLPLSYRFPYPMMCPVPV